jgi:PAS domain S-box-containing protein
MKLKYKINLVSLSILIAVAIAIAGVGLRAINQVVYNLNQKLMAKEVENIIGTIQAAHQVLKDAGVAIVENYVRKAQDDLIDEFRKYKFGSTGKLIIADTIDMRLLNNPFDDKDTVVPGFLAQIKAQGVGSLEHVLGGSKRFFCFAEYPDWHWLIVLSVTTDEMLQVRTRFLASSGAILLPGLVLGSLLFLWFTSKIVNPIRQLADAAASVSRGEWDVSLPNLKTNDEVAQLATAFGEMSVKLALMYQNFQDNLEKIERSQEALAAERERLAVTLRSIGDGVITTDVDGVIVLINKMAEAMTGWNQESGMGKPLHEVFHIIDKNRRESSKNPLEEVISKGKVSSLPKETVLIDIDGKERMISYSGAPILDRDGKILGGILVFHDITERKKAENEKAKLETQLVQVQKMEAIGTLAGGIAHDFNNILGAIVGFTELTMQSVPRDSQDYHNLNQVLKAGERARDLVKQILTFSRQAAHEKKPIQIGSVIKEALKLLRASLPTTIEIKQNLMAPSALILADPSRIHQIMMNLGANAAHAMREEGGLLEVSLEEASLDRDDLGQHPNLTPGLYVQLVVRDTGQGMDQEVMDRIFEPFFTTKEVGDGTGMGLAVVHGIVKSSGGEIMVSSQPGQGTTFTILLPKVASEVATAPAVTAPLPTGDESILFIDDEEMLGVMTKGILQKLGYQVVTQTSSLEALKIFQVNPGKFDLVITDQTMPHLTGMQLAKQLRQLRPDIPIILCTGYSEKVSAETIEAEGINDLLMKPFIMRDLAETVRKVLD